MKEKLPILLPEIILFGFTCAVMVLGVSKTLRIRQATASIAGFGLLIAGIVGSMTQGEVGAPLPGLIPFAKPAIAAVGLLVLLLMSGSVDRAIEGRIKSGAEAFDAIKTNRAEFYSFFLFSITGLMLCTSADDLIWLFLALELTSLPTYVMVTISTRGTASQEAGVKYFFLGALGAAIFLYGFALIYGSTGSTDLVAIRSAVDAAGAINPMLAIGLLLALVGVSFKIAAVPMHFYTADVYQGAAAPVSAMLAFVPKAAGFFAIILLLTTVGWTHGPGGHSLPEAVRAPLWVMAVLTMTVGNVLALLQSSTKRVLAYSSIAHSGYMLVGVIAGPGSRPGLAHNGIGAVLFYLLAYGLMNVGAFAVVASLERRDAAEPTEADDLDELRGLCSTRPLVGWTMVLCSLSLLGFPPALGFFAKVPLFTSGIGAGELPLVIILGLNSAIAAFYYLRLAALPLLEKADGPPPNLSPFVTRRIAGAISAACAVLVGIGANTLLKNARQAAAMPTEAANRARALAAGPDRQVSDDQASRASIQMSPD
ncbi:MAG: NADH-quinone oxidoreductase subunit N [Phycisphaeraceae bacterium]|nr:NADH-quinone oxidoreductase subunit N [Phycisphaeraceae bacterium]